MTSDADPSTRRQRLGAILARVVVPVWIVLGASFKLVDHTPKNLPRSLLDLAGSLGLGAHLDAWLALLIAGEGVAIAVMVFMGRWARPMAIFMLGCFCLILLNELRLGNFTDCGCFGNVPVPPWATLLVDGSLLVGVLACAPGVRPGDLRTSVPIHSEVRAGEAPGRKKYAEHTRRKHFSLLLTDDAA